MQVMNDMEMKIISGTILYYCYLFCKCYHHRH